MNVTIERAALIKQLELNLAAAKKEDERIIARHAEEEEKALALFRSRLSAAMKWDYEKVKKQKFETGVGYHERPTCPRSEATRIALILNSVKLDTRKGNFTASPKTDLYDAIHWLPASKRPKADMCEI